MPANHNPLVCINFLNNLHANLVLMDGWMTDVLPVLWGLSNYFGLGPSKS